MTSVPTPSGYLRPSLGRQLVTLSFLARKKRKLLASQLRGSSHICMYTLYHLVSKSIYYTNCQIWTAVHVLMSNMYVLDNRGNIPVLITIFIYLLRHEKHSDSDSKTKVSLKWHKNAYPYGPTENEFFLSGENQPDLLF